MDPFSALGIEPCFDIDIGVLQERHRELSRALHPDRFVGRPASERRMALSRAIEVNEAWRRLRDPVLRAEALLASMGMQTSEASSSETSPELLMDMMDQRELLAEARSERDTKRVAELKASMQSREQDLLHSLSEAFSREQRSAPKFLGELRFVRRFLDEVAAAEDDIL